MLVRMSTKFVLAFLAVGFIAYTVNGSNCGDSTNSERLCGNDPSKLWLDIVIVIDNAKGMTKKGIDQVAGQIVSLFDEKLLFGIHSDEPRTTRVGIVLYNAKATVVADLNNITSQNDLESVVLDALVISDEEDSYLETGLEAAQTLLNDQSFNTDRDHYQKLVIVYASEYRRTNQYDPIPVSQRLKQSATIATVAFSQDNTDGFLKELAVIATPGYTFTNDQNVVAELQSTMLQVNCYCPNGWTQYRQSFSNEHSFKYGSCLSTGTLVASYLGAKISCRGMWNQAHLVNELTQTKHNYVFQLVSNDTHFTQPYTYYIGLLYSGGSWNWDQASGQPAVTLGNGSFWLPGYPSASSTKVAVVNQQPSSSNPDKVGWVNVEKTQNWMYVCEVISCDSTNYCEAENE